MSLAQSEIEEALKLPVVWRYSPNDRRVMYFMKKGYTAIIYCIPGAPGVAIGTLRWSIYEGVESDFFSEDHDGEIQGGVTKEYPEAEETATSALEQIILRNNLQGTR